MVRKKEKKGARKKERNSGVGKNKFGVKSWVFLILILVVVVSVFSIGKFFSNEGVAFSSTPSPSPTGTATPTSTPSVSCSPTTSQSICNQNIKCIWNVDIERCEDKPKQIIRSYGDTDGGDDPETAGGVYVWEEPNCAFNKKPRFIADECSTSEYPQGLMEQIATFGVSGKGDPTEMCAPRSYAKMESCQEICNILEGIGLCKTETISLPLVGEVNAGFCKCYDGVGSDADSDAGDFPFIPGHISHYYDPSCSDMESAFYRRDICDSEGKILVEYYISSGKFCDREKVQHKEYKCSDTSCASGGGINGKAYCTTNAERDGYCTCEKKS